MDEICFKCGTKEGTIIKHHLRYKPQEIIVDCCRKCHVEIHKRIRRENKCQYSIGEINRLSHISEAIRYAKRNITKISFSESIMPHVQLFENIDYNYKTGNVCISSYFHSYDGMKLYTEEI